MLSTITWTLPRPAKSKYKGAFPLYFEANLLQLLGWPDQVLQPFGGMAEYGTRVDIRPEVNPDVLGDAHELPFPDGSFDCTILDPPYSDGRGDEMYETAPLNPSVYIAEAVRVTREGGYVVLYGEREPRRPARCNHMLRIVVNLRPGHSPRVRMVFQKRKPGMPHYGTEAGEEEGGEP